MRDYFLAVVSSGDLTVMTGLHQPSHRPPSKKVKSRFPNKEIATTACNTVTHRT